METIIENGKRMEGIPYPVAVWDAKSGMWDDSIEELSSERRTYRRDKCGTFRVYEVSIPYSDIIGEGEEAYTEDPYTEYEEWEWYNALKED